MIEYFKKEMKYLFLNRHTWIYITILWVGLAGLFITLQRDTSMNEEVSLLSQDSNYLEVIAELMDEAQVQLNMDHKSQQISQEDYEFINKNLKDSKINMQQAMQYASRQDEALYYKKSLQAYYAMAILSESGIDFKIEKAGYREIQKEIHQIEQQAQLQPVSFSTKNYDLGSRIHNIGSYYSLMATYMKEFQIRINKQLPIITPFSNDSVSIIYHYFYSLIPAFLIILIPLMSFSFFHNYKKNGLLNSLLIVPKMRNRILHIRLFSQLVYVLSVLCIPILSFSLCLGFQDHYKMILYPTLAYKQGVTSLAFGYNNLQEIKEDVMKTTGVTSQYAAYSERLGLVAYSADTKQKMSPSLTLLPFYEFLGYCVILIIVCAIFLINFTHFLSVFVKQQFLSLFLSISIGLLGFRFSSPMYTSWIAGLNPFQFFNTPLIVGGTSTFPFLLGVIVLVAYSLLLNAITRYIMNRKDV